MSATFKNAKKKATQSELRRIMNEHKKLAKDVKKINSPLAKYNDLGQLTCILCKSVVKSEAVWPVHLNSKQHKENIELAKKLKEQTNNFTTFKRPHSPIEAVPVKKLKGILKNSNNNLNKSTESENDDTPPNKVPDDFFDSNNKSSKSHKNVLPNAPKKEEVNEEPMDSDDILPEGFFDDPKQDAKARHQEYKDPVEEEWERFQKEIRDADNESAAIIAEDQDEATTERQIDEIDEQINNWSRVVNLEKKKVEIVVNVKEQTNKMEDEDLSVDDEENFDEFLDWRSKKSFK